MTTVRKATIILPFDGKNKWTALMQGDTKVSDAIYENQPIVMETTKFENGIAAVAGVLKSKTPDTFNMKFVYVFDEQGNLIHEPYQPVDVSDHEDWHTKGINFILNDDESVEYQLTFEEKAV